MKNIRKDLISNTKFPSMKYAVITGVSTGIGLASLEAFVQKGYHVFGSVRNQEDSKRLKERFGDSYTPLLFDVTDADAVANAAIEVTKILDGASISCLVNNSGIAIGGPLQFQDIETIDLHFQINVIGLMRVTKVFLPLLGAREDFTGSPGKIINISSVAGRIAAPFVGAYVGSKHAVEGLSHSLRRELLIYGIDVIIVGPGSVKTPIWDKGINMEKYGNTPYGSILKRFGKAAKKGGEQGLEASYLGAQIVKIAEESNPKVRYAFVPKKFTNWTIPKLLPHRTIDRIIKKRVMKR